MKKPPLDEMGAIHTGRHRIKWSSLVLLVPLSFIVGRMVWLHSAGASTGKVLSFEKRTVLPAQRGQLLADNGTSMAVTVDEYTITANPRGIDDKAKMAKTIAEAIGGDEEKYFSLFQKTTQPNGSPNYYVRLEQHVSKDKVDHLKKLMRPPVGKDGKEIKETKRQRLARRNFWAPIAFELTPKRQYPMGNFASQLIGLTDPSGKGITGLERGFNQLLAGKDGEIISQEDSRHRPLPDFTDKWVDPVNGGSVLTTIDPVIQAAADETLRHLAAQFKPKFATAVVLRPKTGEIVALANAPSFDPNHRPTNVIDLATNRAINFSYEPGSTFKIITASAAVENVKDWATRQFYCAGAEMVGHHLIHCWISSTSKGKHGWETLSDGIRDSCNIAMNGFASLMGADKMMEYARKFGVGETIDLPHLETQSGYLPRNDPQKWSPEQLANFSFGQGMMMTPYQVARLAAIIANDGVMMKPLLIKGILDSSGNIVKRYKPEMERRVIAPETARAVKAMMERVVNEGTAKVAAVPGYQVAGKTGSAQVADGTRGYSSGKFISSFVGFLPADHPEYVILVMANEPNGSHWGSEVCGPAFSAIAQKAMLRLRIQEGTAAPAPDPALMHPDKSSEE